MDKKSAADTLSKQIELINNKVREINERRRGMKITYIEDDLDRQELKNYMRFMGVEQGSISLESVEEEIRAPKNYFYYLTLGIEVLIELVLLSITLSYLMSPTLDTMDYMMASLLMGMFVYLAYVMFKSIKGK